MNLSVGRANSTIAEKIVCAQRSPFFYHDVSAGEKEETFSGVTDMGRVFGSPVSLLTNTFPNKSPVQCNLQFSLKKNQTKNLNVLAIVASDTYFL